MNLEPTPSQTIGPFFHDALLDRDRSELVSPGDPSAIRITGTVYDGAGEPVPDAMVEIWQADAAGRFDDPPLEPGAFSGFGRSDTRDGGKYTFVTIKPGPIPGPGETLQAPHVMLSIFARGLLKRAVTRLYFPDEEEANARDPVLTSIEDGRLRDSLVARAEGDAYLFDIRLQGEYQTAFFEFGE